MDYLYQLWKLIFFVDLFGSMQVAELSWGNDDHISAVCPPFDYIIGTDVVSFSSFLHFFLLWIYAEKLLVD